MAVIKHSKQREAIREFLYSRHDHPTAEVVYKNIIKDYPRISLGTVYRNLAFLVDQGLAITVPCEDGSVHFDGRTEPHYHFQCKKCKAISDIELNDKSFEDEMRSRVQSVCNQGKIDGHVTFFYGICNDCLNK
ncbi:MAG: transcriptional repressor [Clostridiales bacterium]|nr:transcriptional repressor [Clostridiales bacterium]MBS5878384.1 transcriptional repressor [Clostridiales bacterium]MDU0939832.1 transcriptional repressor [Clostridiales bacterium]MDU1042676.1 transcriptional repressor [Clostridiales bacterium]MDU3489546.1 transcriptional repressor [Clostridiales bacterium]